MMAQGLGDEVAGFVAEMDGTDALRETVIEALRRNWPTEDGGLYGKGGAWHGWGAIADVAVSAIEREAHRFAKAMEDYTEHTTHAGTWIEDDSV